MRPLQVPKRCVEVHYGSKKPALVTKILPVMFSRIHFLSLWSCSGAIQRPVEFNKVLFMSMRGLNEICMKPVQVLMRPDTGYYTGLV